MKQEQGQSLIEVVAAVAVIVLVVLALISLTTVAIRNSSFSNNQALATKYAQEGIERVRSYRGEVDWFTFSQKINCEDPTGLANLDPVTTGFTRTVSCTLDPTDPDKNTMNVVVTVSWQSSKGTHQSQLSTKLTKWK